MRWSSPGSVLFTLFQCYHQKINGCKIGWLMAFLAAPLKLPIISRFQKNTVSQKIIVCLLKIFCHFPQLFEALKHGASSHKNVAPVC